MHIVEWCIFCPVWNAAFSWLITRGHIVSTMPGISWNRSLPCWQEWQPSWRWTSMGKSQMSTQWSWWWNACGSTTRPITLIRGYVRHNWKCVPGFNHYLVPPVIDFIFKRVKMGVFSLQRRRFLCGTSWTSLVPKCSTQTTQAVPWLLSFIFRVSWLTPYSGLCRTCRKEVITRCTHVDVSDPFKRHKKALKCVV